MASWRISGHLINILPDSPKNATWIADTKITHLPWLKFNWPKPDAVLGYNVALLDFIPPCVNIGDEHVHHEILGEALGAEVLKQKAHMVEVKVGNATAFRGHGEANIPVKLFR